MFTRHYWWQGRFKIYFEPRDLWFGMFIGSDALYICLVPTIVIRWKWK